MEKPSMLLSARLVVPFIIFVVLLAFLMPRKNGFSYTYHKGDRWKYETLVATFDFPILKTEEQLRSEKEKMRSKYVPYYTRDEDVFFQVSSSIQESLPHNGYLAKALILELRPYYEKGILPASNTSQIDYAEEDQDIIFIQKQKKAYKTARNEVYSREMAKRKVLLAVAKDMNLPVASVDSVLDPLDIYEKILPNLIFDKNTTEMVYQKSVDFISPTSGIFRAGNVIVSMDDVITAETEQILDSYAVEFSQSIGYNRPSILMWLGNFIMALIFALLVFGLFIFSNSLLLKEINKFYFVLTMFVMASLASFSLTRLPSYVYYLIPFPVFALYFMAFFRNKMVLPLYSLCLLPMLLFCQDSPYFFIISLFSGFTAAFTFKYFNRGRLQFLSALIIFASTLMSYMAFYLMNGFNNTIDANEILLMFVGSLIVVLTYPLIYLFEIVFGIVSANSLRNLTDTNNKLLRELSDKAPGTFQHSLAVMNLADAAARSIDADVLLVRAAALFHDVGKIYNPQCFVENQISTSVDYHSTLSPLESANQIIRHVTDGVEIAEKHGIPSVVCDFILTHHGTTSAMFFYNKYLKAGGTEDHFAEFCYPGPKPQTKEQIILMVADSVEAASRTLSDFSPEHISAFVDNIFDGKMNAGQFSDASITLSEIETVKAAIKTYLLQSHHKRIAYPNATKTNKNSKNENYNKKSR